MRIERLAVECKFAQSDDGTTFEGLASTYDRDLHNDVVAPGAFTRTIAEHKAAGTRPALLWSHDPSEPIGVIDALGETDEGLMIKGRLAETSRARDARALGKMGALGLSIGFVARKATAGANGTRVLEDVLLVECSMTGSPANPGARLTVVKAADAAERSDAMSTNTTGAAPDLAAFEAKMAALAADLKAAADRTDALETALARPAIVTKAGDLTPEQKAFNTFVAKGREALTADEVKDLRVSDDTTGGYLAPQQFVAELIRNIVLFSPVRQAARIGSTAASSVVIPRRTSRMTASWVSETEDRSETQPAYGSLEIPVHEMACHIDVSVKLLEDSAVNLEAELAFDFGEDFGRLEGATLLNGDGIKKPLGLVQTPGITTVKTGNANGLGSAGFDSVMDLYHALPSPYAANAVWGANRTTIGTLRKLKDSTGRYLWADPVAQGQPATILGRPVVEMPDLADIGAGAKPLVFGDFSNLRIYDRTGGLSILRNPYVLADKGLVRFHGRRRVGAGVTRTEAFRFLEIGV